MKRQYQQINTALFIERAKKIHGEKYDYSLVEYINSVTKVTIKCNKCENIWSVLPHNHFSGKGCKKCQYKNLPQNQAISHEEFLNKAKNIHGDKFEYVSKYIANKKNITIKCLVCENIFKQKAHSHLEGKGCKRCQYKNLLQNNPMIIDEFENRCKKIHDYKYEYCQDYKGNKYKINIFCKKHNFWFKQNAGGHLYHGQGCPRCNCSKGELKILSFLKDKNIKYELEKKFDECRFVLPLSFDFYLPENNICIEYDGEQHYVSIACFGGEKYLKDVKNKDKIKNDFCKKNKIKLIRIPFYEFNNIDEILREKIC